MVKIPARQEKQSIEPRDYEVRILVAGSRKWNNQREFHETLCAYLERFEGQDVLFISGKAWSGPDDLIIRWCKHYGFPCKEMEADWDNPDYRTASGKSRAGMVRNAQMATIATHGLIFWDQHSPGTANMIDEGIRHGLNLKIVNVSVAPEQAETQEVVLPETITAVV